MAPCVNCVDFVLLGVERDGSYQFQLGFIPNFFASTREGIVFVSSVADTISIGLSNHETPLK